MTSFQEAREAIASSSLPYYDLQPVLKCVSYYEERGIESNFKDVLLEKKKLIVTGMTGSGKRQVCQYVIDLVAQEEGISDIQNIEVNLAQETKENVEHLKELLSHSNHLIKVIFFTNVTQENVAEVIKICKAKFAFRVYVVIATKNGSLYPRDVTQTVHGMSFEQINNLLQKLNVSNCSNEDVKKIISKFDGLPLAVVSGAKHMESCLSSFNEYMQDSAGGYERCSFTEGEYESNTGIKKAVKRDLTEVCNQLNRNERAFLFKVACMGKPVPIDILAPQEIVSDQEIVNSKLIDNLQSRSLAKVYRKGNTRILALNSCVREELLEMSDENRDAYVKNAMKMVNWVFGDEIRFTNEFILQLYLFNISVHLLHNCSGQTQLDLEMISIFLDMYTKVGYMFRKLKMPDEAETAFDSALNYYDKLFMNNDRGKKFPLKICIMQGLCKSVDSGTLIMKFIKQIGRTLNNWTDDMKWQYHSFITGKVYNQLVSDDHVAFWNEGSTKREEEIFKENPRNMSPNRYKFLISKGKALPITLVEAIYPYELLYWLLYNTGQMCYRFPELAKRYFDLCRDLRKHVSQTFKVNLLPNIPWETNGHVCFLLDNEAVNVYATFLKSTQKCFKNGLLMYHNGGPSYYAIMCKAQILKALILSLKDEQHRSGAVFVQTKEMLVALQGMLNDANYDPTTRVKILIIMGQAYIEVGKQKKNDQHDFDKANTLLTEVCNIVGNIEGPLINALHTDWQEALELLQYSFGTTNLEMMIEEYRVKCSQAIMDEMAKKRALDSAEDLLSVVREANSIEALPQIIYGEIHSYE